MIRYIVIDEEEDVRPWVFDNEEDAIKKVKKRCARWVRLDYAEHASECNVYYYLINEDHRKEVSHG